MGACAVLILLLLTGCATSQERQVAQTWRTICRTAPYQSGDTIPKSVLMAFYTLPGFPSATDVNQRCQR